MLNIGGNSCILFYVNLLKDKMFLIDSSYIAGNYKLGSLDLVPVNSPLTTVHISVRGYIPYF
jgi:hypothetical protein